MVNSRKYCSSTRFLATTARAGTQVDFDGLGGLGTNCQVRSGLLDPEGNNSIVDNIDSPTRFGRVLPEVAMEIIWEKTEEDPWAELDKFNNPDFEPISDEAKKIAEKVKKIHPEDLIGIDNIEEYIDEIISGPPTWQRERDGVEAFIDEETGLVIINNPIDPTGFIPTDKTPEEYLLDDDFKRI